MEAGLDALDLRLLEILSEQPRAGVLEISRLANVARATVTARMERLRAAGVVRGYGPEIDLSAAGFPVQAFVTLEIAQGRLDEVQRHLAGMASVLEAYAITGSGDVLLRVAAASNEALQAVLLELTRSEGVQRSTSVMVLSVVVAPRVLPLLRSASSPPAGRAPYYREARDGREGGDGREGRPGRGATTPGPAAPGPAIPGPTPGPAAPGPAAPGPARTSVAGGGSRGGAR